VTREQIRDPAASEIPTQVRARTVAKVRTLLEALPFMQAHRGAVVVIKVGGAVLERAPLSRSFAADVSLLQHAGIHPVIVHGGGPQVSELSERLGLEPRFVDGLRVTDEATLEVATMVLAGSLNTRIVSMLVAGDVSAVGLSGVDGGLTVAERRERPDLGLVGDVARVDATLLRTVMAKGFVPVVASIATGPGGTTLNVNADVMASELAIGLVAGKLIYLSDVPGVIGPDGLLSELRVQDALDLLAGGDAVGGMIPKLESAVRALKAGVSRVHLLDGRVPHALVLELFTPEGIGTMISPDAAGEEQP
jgi:acetylglutamate kinase